MKRLLCLLPLLTTPALAQDALPFTYEMFEASTLHADLDTCPRELSGPDRFCRATLYMDALHVFVFSDKGDQPLIDFLSYDAAALHTILKTPIPN